MTSELTLLYFAYGSNMDPEQMRERCRGATCAGPAALPDYRFLINSDGVATIMQSAGDQVLGVLWRVTPRHLEALDRYEGVRRRLYRRTDVEVVTETEPVIALVYIAAESAEGRPTGEYLGRILAGARANGIPDDYIESILRYRAR